MTTIRIRHAWMWSPSMSLALADQPIRESVVKPHQNLLTIIISRFSVTVTASPSASSNQKDPITLHLDMATQFVHLTGCQDFWRTSPGFYMPQNPLFLLPTCPESKKCALSLNQTSSKNSGSSSILYFDHRHITTHFAMSAGVSFYFIGILYGCRWRSLIRILCNEARERPSFRLNLWMDFFGLFPTDSPTAFRLRRVLALSFLPNLGVSVFLLSLFTVPVAQNLCVH